MKPGLWRTFHRLIQILAAHGAKVPIFCDILARWVTGEWHVPELMRFIQKRPIFWSKSHFFHFHFYIDRTTTGFTHRPHNIIGLTVLVIFIATVKIRFPVLQTWQDEVCLLLLLQQDHWHRHQQMKAGKLIRQDRWAGRVWQKSQRDLMFSLVLSSHSAGLDFSVRAVDFYFEISRGWISWFSC